MGAHSRNAEGGVQFAETIYTKMTSDDDNDDDLSPLEATYSSLIQQYLSVFLFDNATFLAERLVASCNTNHAYYLLALCHFRANAPQRSKNVLLSKNQDSTPAMQYLLAQCCCQLQEYGLAEEALLRNVRSKFRQATLKDDSLESSNIDQWILSTSVRTSI